MKEGGEGSLRPEESAAGGTRFFGFQVCALGGLLFVACAFTLLSGGRGPLVWLNAVLFAAAGTVAACLLAARYGRKWGVAFLVGAPILILAGGVITAARMRERVPDVTPDIHRALDAIRRAYLARLEGDIPGKGMTICSLEGSPEGRGIPREIARADYFFRGEGKRPFKGYWFALVRLNSEGKPYAEAGGFALTCFPQVYGATGRYIYLMNARGDFYRIDLGGAFYIYRYPGPDPTACGWRRLKR